MKIVDIIREQVLLRIFEENVERIIKVVNLLSKEELWYSPNENTNSIANLILHLYGNVRQWIGSGVGGLEDIRERDMEFITKQNYNSQELISLMQELKLEIEPIINQLTHKDLVKEITVQGFNETGLSALIHVIEHFSYHTGQIAQMCKLIKDVDLKFYDGLDLNILTD